MKFEEAKAYWDEFLRQLDDLANNVTKGILMIESPNNPAFPLLNKHNADTEPGLTKRELVSLLVLHSVISEVGLKNTPMDEILIITENVVNAVFKQGR